MKDKLNFKFLKMIFILVFLKMPIFSVCHILQSENIAEDHLVFQQEMLNENYTPLRITNYETSYSHDHRDSRWTIIDLEKFYDINEICFLTDYCNKNVIFLRIETTFIYILFSGEHAKYFNVFADETPFNGEDFCFQITSNLRKTTGHSEANYQCFSCTCKGSFLRLQKYSANQYFVMNHIRIRGSIVKASGMELNRSLLFFSYISIFFYEFAQ